MYAIQILNKSTLISQAELQPIVSALQIQVSRDFAPFYNIDAQLTLTNADNGGTPIYLVDSAQDAPAGALAWHTTDDKGRPYGLIPMKTVRESGWPVASTISHELLEMLADPYCNSSKLAVWPATSRSQAYIAYENCDPVENDSYKINGIDVSNFVTPNWFRPHSTSPWDFMRRLTGPLTMTRGGYLQWWRGGAWHSVNFGRTSVHYYHSRHRRRERSSFELSCPGYHEKIRQAEQQVRALHDVRKFEVVLSNNFGADVNRVVGLTFAGKSL